MCTEKIVVAWWPGSAKIISAMVYAGIMTRNEARGYEDMNPIDGLGWNFATGKHANVKTNNW
jgi:hypothetical protein